MTTPAEILDLVINQKQSISGSLILAADKIDGGFDLLRLLTFPMPTRINLIIQKFAYTQDMNMDYLYLISAENREDLDFKMRSFDNGYHDAFKVQTMKDFYKMIVEGWPCAQIFQIFKLAWDRADTKN